MGFFKNFVDTFAMQGYTVYIAGESYAGVYIPYFADAFLNANDTQYYNLSGILIYDGTYNYESVWDNIPTAGYVDYWNNILDLNQSFVDQVHNISDTCGYTSFMEDNLVYPPKGILPSPPNADDKDDSCNVWNMVFEAATLVNPCFDIYQSTYSLLYTHNFQTNPSQSQPPAPSSGTFSASPAPSTTFPTAPSSTST